MSAGTQTDRPADEAGVVAEGPLSLTQEQLWYLTRLDPTSAFYNVPVQWRIDGPLDLDAVQRAVRRVVAGQAALRTVFIDGVDRTRQVVTSAVDLPVEIHEPSTPEEVDATARRLAAEPFDLAVGAARVALIRSGPEQTRLLLVLHHIICDGWSMEVLFAQLLSAYAEEMSAQTDTPELAEPTYLDYARHQRRRVSGDHRQRLVDYWSEHLAGAPPVISLPTDFARPVAPTSQGDRLPCSLPAATGRKLVDLARNSRTTPFVVLLSCLYITLSQLGGDSNIVIGTPVANRNRREDQDIVGFYAETLCIHTEIDPALVFADFLVAVRRIVVACFRHRELPFGTLVRELRPSRTSANPIFQVMFALQNVPNRPRPSFDNTFYTVLPDERTTSIFDLRLDLTQSGTGFEGFLEYNTSLFTSTRADTIKQRFLQIVDEAVGDPETVIARLGASSNAVAASHPFNEDLGA